MKEARKGNIHQVLYFSRNYSESMTIIRDGRLGFNDEDFEFQQINVYRDVIGKLNLFFKQYFLSEISIQQFWISQFKYRSVSVQ